MTYQFHRKGASLRLFSTGKAIFYLLYIMLIAYSVWEKTARPLLACFALALWGVYIIGGEMWYESYYGISFVLLFGAFYPTAAAFHRRIFSWNILKTKAAKTVAAAALFCFFTAATYVGYHAMPYHRSFVKIWRGGWCGMNIERTDIPYITGQDIATVKKYLRTLQQSPTPVYVRFFPVGDELFFTDMETPTLRFDDSAFTTFPPGASIIHVSRHTTHWWYNDMKKEIAAIGVQDGDASHTLLQRDSTEIFYYGEQRRQ
jgi:hypothetical protein